MNIVQRLHSLLDFDRRYHVFVLSHEDADALLTEIGRATGQPPDRSAVAWSFHHVPVIAAEVHKSYAVEGWEQPVIHML